MKYISLFIVIGCIPITMWLIHLLYYRSVVGNEKPTDYVIALAAIAAVIVSAFQTFMTQSTLEEMKRQTLLDRPPNIRILPEEMANGERGKFELELFNSGVSDIANIRIYEDYLICSNRPNAVPEFSIVGSTQGGPFYTHKLLKTGNSIKFKLNFTDRLDIMHKQYTAIKGANNSRLVRLTIKYLREEDKMPFQKKKVYIITGDESGLSDMDDRNIAWMPGMKTYTELKRYLGAD